MYVRNCFVISINLLYACLLKACCTAVRTLYIRCCIVQNGNGITFW